MIESYESNDLRRKFFIESQSYVNLLQILWIKEALSAHLAPNLCTLVIKGCCCCKLHAGFPIFCLLLKQNPNRLKSRAEAATSTASIFRNSSTRKYRLVVG
jgi:hypothetical protein